jgi:hypothetical protein
MYTQYVTIKLTLTYTKNFNDMSKKYHLTFLVCTTNITDDNTLNITITSILILLILLLPSIFLLTQILLSLPILLLIF